MSAATDQKKDPAPRKTGDAQYRVEKAAIAERNDAARKAGKAMRLEEDKKAAARRRALDIAERDSLAR